MNKKQLIVMWIGIGVIVFIALFPPTLISITKDDKLLPEDTLEDLRYFDHEIVTRPVFLFTVTGKQREIQYSKMGLCQFAIALITSGLIVTLNKKKAR